MLVAQFCFDSIDFMDIPLGIRHSMTGLALRMLKCAA